MRKEDRQFLPASDATRPVLLSSKTVAVAKSGNLTLLPTKFLCRNIFRQTKKQFTTIIVAAAVTRSDEKEKSSRTKWYKFPSKLPAELLAEDLFSQRDDATLEA